MQSFLTRKALTRNSTVNPVYQPERPSLLLSVANILLMRVVARILDYYKVDIKLVFKSMLVLDISFLAYFVDILVLPATTATHTVTVDTTMG